MKTHVYDPNNPSGRTTSMMNVSKHELLRIIPGPNDIVILIDRL